MSEELIVNSEKLKTENMCIDCKQKPAKEHFDNGLSVGSDHCDECFEDMRSECRRRSW